MFRLAVFGHGPGAQLLDSAGAWLPNARNVMSWSGSCAQFRDYGRSPPVDVGSCLLALRGLCLPELSGLSGCRGA